MPDFWQISVLTCEGLAVLAGLLAFRYNYPAPLKTISKLWIMMLGVELLGHFYPGEDDTWLYNLFFPVFYFTLINSYQSITRHDKLRVLVQVLDVIFVLFVLWNSLFFQGVFIAGKLQSATIVVGSTMIIIVGCSYLIELIISEDKQALSSNPYYWLTLSLIIYSVGSVPFLGMLNYLHDKFPDFTYSYFHYIYNTCSILLNIGIAVTFVCRAPYLKLS